MILALMLAFAMQQSDACGIVPIKPPVPIGCKDIVPVCQCDVTGTHCHWEWVCQKEAQ